MKISAKVECAIPTSFRVNQIRGMFDLAPASRASETFEAELPDAEEQWQLGLIVGPSGSGKSTIAQATYGDLFKRAEVWSETDAIIDGFNPSVDTKEIVFALSSVGLSSPPHWVRPYWSLSMGEKFRCDLARALCSNDQLIVFDEFTSLVNRTVARCGTIALSKAIRTHRIKKQFIAVTCHYDVLEWMQPDWVLDMANKALTRRGLQPRDELSVKVTRVHHSTWELFRRFHYLSGTISKSAYCFLASIDDSPAAFSSVISFPHSRAPGWRGHRLVVMPDFQGIGLGNKLEEFVASLFSATGKPFYSTSSHPGIVHYRMRSPLWSVTRKMSRADIQSRVDYARSQSFRRETASFRFCGKPRSDEARDLQVIS